MQIWYNLAGFEIDFSMCKQILMLSKNGNLFGTKNLMIIHNFQYVGSTKIIDRFFQMENCENNLIMFNMR